MKGILAKNEIEIHIFADFFFYLIKQMEQLSQKYFARDF